jgi:hypothetical protein
MTTEPKLTYIQATGQVVQDYLPTGAAGGAWLHPSPDIELIFDRATDCLASLRITAGTAAGRRALSDRGAAFLDQHFGDGTAVRIRRVTGSRRAGAGLGPMTDPGGVLSALARLHAGRATTPVPFSPWWDVQEAQLALQAGLEWVACTAAVQAVRSLAHAELATVTARQAEAALAAAAIACPTDTTAAGQVLARVGAATVLSLDEYLQRRPAEPAPADQPAAGRAPDVLRWALDFTIIPRGTFLPALSAQDDLLVGPGSRPRSAAVIARLAPGANRDALRKCRARLVLPAERRVLSQAPFSWPGPQVVAELALPPSAAQLNGAWIEVVDDELRPVRSATLRLFKCALRSADAALRAGQEPRGLNPYLTSQQWAELAADGWRQSAQAWQAAGDTDRARLASQAGACVVPEPALAEEAGW